MLTRLSNSRIKITFKPHYENTAIISCGKRTGEISISPFFISEGTKWDQCLKDHQSPRI
jgi:hypothetical protein